jgi:hypothetical protein
MKKSPSLLFCLIMDGLGMLTFAVPWFGEFGDIFWAPVSALIFYASFGGKKGALLVPCSISWKKSFLSLILYPLSPLHGYTIATVPRNQSNQHFTQVSHIKLYLTFNFITLKLFNICLFRPSMLLVTGFFSGIFTVTLAQENTQVHVKEPEVRETLAFLSSDEMGGRATFSPQIDVAAGYIAKAFSTYGLKQMPGNDGYLQTFTMVKSRPGKVTKATIGKETISQGSIAVQTSENKLTINQGSGYEVSRLKEGENAMAIFRALRGKKGNQLVLMHTSHEPFFNRIKQNNNPRMKDGSTIVYVLTAYADETTFDIELEPEIEEVKLSNVVGLLPGKTRPEEYVIFSGHYDHIGFGKPNESGDSIYNGANDDASGTTAVMMLAKHFAAVGQQERSLIFTAFTAEEVGGFGSQYFSKQLNPEKVIAMFNIEMIGTDSKWGTNSAYITGYEKTNMGEILQKNLNGSGFIFHPDPYPQQQLFYRSDNATLARLGVPAHTISTSKMDIEPHYHKASDEIGTLDTKNMTEIIKAIALSSKSIVQGIDTPSRVETSQLR